MELPAGRRSGNTLKMSTGLATASSELTLTRLNVTERWEKALEMVDNVVHPVCPSMRNSVIQTQSRQVLFQHTLRVQLSLLLDSQVQQVHPPERALQK